jgi:hypothetical protein
MGLKESLVIADGYRESAQSWRIAELLNIRYQHVRNVVNAPLKRKENASELASRLY